MREFPSYFADAEESFGKSKFVIFGVPYDKTSSFRYGARLAPREIRTASWNFETFDISLGIDFSDIPIHDYGDIDVEEKESREMIEEISKLTRKIVESGKIPVALGGEHTISVGAIENFDDIHVIFLDAHLDFRDEYENNKYSHACTLRRIADRVGVSNITALGIRSAEKTELEEARKEGLKIITSREIRHQGIENILKEMSKDLDKQNIYLSLDFDVIDPSHAPGVSTPEPFGLSPEDIIKVIENFSNRMVGFDLVEVCPTYDMGITSILAAKIIRIAIAEMWKKQPLYRG